MHTQRGFTATELAILIFFFLCVFLASGLLWMLIHFAYKLW